MRVQSLFFRSLLLGGIFVVVFGSPAHGQQIQVSGANRTIAITTTEEAERRADTAVVHIGYQLYALTSAQVAEQAGCASKAITTAILATGVPKDAMESQSQGTGPVQEYQLNQIPAEDRAQRKFEATQEWTVRIPAGDAARVLAAAVDAGANQSGNIEWSIADEASLSAEAAGKALKHAQAIAEQMAAGLGAKLGPLVYASNEAQQLRVLPINGRTGGGGGGGMALAAAQRVEISLSVPLVHRSATVSAVFSIQ
jgi:uncharacterized protein YggE